VDGGIWGGEFLKFKKLIMERNELLEVYYGVGNFFRLTYVKFLKKDRNYIIASNSSNQVLQIGA